MAYARKTTSKSKASRKTKRPRSSISARTSRTRSAPKRTTRSTRSSPSTIRIQLVQAAPQELSPVTRALMEMGRVTPPPRRAKF